MGCGYEETCLNYGRCLRCIDRSLLKLKGERTRRPLRKQKTDLNKKDSWKGLEQDVADMLNRIPSIEQARRSRGSGNQWFETGDVVDSILHPECKERTARELKSGEHSISIRKEWLDKSAEECLASGKTMCLPFRFKGSEQIYCIFSMNDIAELVTSMKAYMRDNEILLEKIKTLQK